MTYRSFSLLLLLAACGDDALPATDASTRDAQTQDAADDAGPVSQDAGAEDAFLRDAGPSDAGSDSGPTPDANMSDAGPRDVSGPCRPFTSEGCEAGSWCKPQGLDVSVSMCEASGDQEPGDVCITSIDCVAGAICSEHAEGGICERACDPESPQGSERNPCMSGTRCSNLRHPETGEPVSLGVCVPACDYDAGVPCSGELTCQPNELVSGDIDICLPGVTVLPAQGDCALAGVPHGQLCGPGRICLDRAEFRPGNVCYQVCRGNVGPLNTVDHPDCDPAQMCTQFAIGLGVCL